MKVKISIPATMNTLWIGKPTYTSTSDDNMSEEDYNEAKGNQENHDYDEYPDTFYDEELGRDVEYYKGLRSLLEI